MSVNPCFLKEGKSPDRTISLVCVAFLLLALHTGAAAAAVTETTPAGNATTAETETTAAPDDGSAGGSVFFTTYPTGATIWVDDEELGTSDFTYYFEKTGTYRVRAGKKGYEEYTGQVTVSTGRRVDFEAVLREIPRGIVTESTTVATPVPTATTFERSTLTLPTPWPTSPQAPVDPAVVAGAVALGIGLVAARRR
jgi:hypothetical protein